MIRLIIKRKILDRHSDLASESFETIDCECPELEAVLQRGGAGMNSYDYSQLVGVEVITKEKP
jgi:hypothetical protein